MSKDSGAKERQRRKIAKAEKEIRLRIINSSYKCTICGAWIKYQLRKRHLRREHNLFPDDIKSYFLDRKAVREEKKEERLSEILRAEYERCSGRAVNGHYKCGERVSGAPFVRIIYNAVGTNRRKH
ncbi:MAG: hypothetical protein K2K93_11010 [Muribaculaceae bacterium]|nr:hypothetical protein [Muribaculaceae bacterium]